MAGPKAPIGSLTRHAQQSAKLASTLAANKFSSRPSKNAKPVKEESESESSDSDSDASVAGEEDNDNFLRRLHGKSSGSQPKATAAVSKATKHAAAAKKEQPAGIAEMSGSSSEEASSEEESESESEDEEAAVKAKGAKATSQKPQNVERDSDTSESESESDESEDDEGTNDNEGGANLEAANSKRQTQKTPSPPRRTAAEKEASRKTAESRKGTTKKNVSTWSSSEASGSETSGSESDEETDESMAVAKRNGTTDLSHIPEVVSSDFHLRKAGDGTDATDVAKFFSQAKLEGKQIWYFTAPASISIEVVEKLEIPLERAQQGLSILSHKGDDYGVAFEDASTSRAIKLVIPNKAGDQYHMLDQPVAQTMHLKRVTQFSQDGNSSFSLTQTTSTGRPPRPQPPNLKARYLPFGIKNRSMGNTGVDASSERDEDVEMTEAPSLPSSNSTPSKKSKKVKSQDAEATSTDKKKKRKHETVAESTPTRSDQPESTKKSKKPRTGEPAATGEPISSSQAIKQTPVLPPVPHFNGRLSQAARTTTPSSSQAPKSNGYMPLFSSQPTPTPIPTSNKKESKIPLPPNFQRSASMSRSSPIREDTPRTNGKEKKSKKASNADVSPEVTKKTTPVPLPNNTVSSQPYKPVNPSPLASPIKSIVDTEGNKELEEQYGVVPETPKKVKGELTVDLNAKWTTPVKFKKENREKSTSVKEEAISWEEERKHGVGSSPMKESPAQKFIQGLKGSIKKYDEEKDKESIKKYDEKKDKERQRKRDQKKPQKDKRNYSKGRLQHRRPSVAE